MGCESCSNKGGGLPAGCRNNGSCGVDGCNKLDVFDWLSGMDLPDSQKPFDIVEVRFKNSRKSFYRNTGDLELQVGDVVTVESSPGHDVGIVSVVGELVRLQMNKKGVKDNHEVKKIYRKATQEDITTWQEVRMKENDTMMISREIADSLGLVMKISDVEYQGDGKKVTIYYTAEGRVDFRDLIRKLAESFKTRIEMRQIGARQEAGRLGGIGSCGRELCCSTWLTDFRSVSTSAARYQQLSLNPQKLAGQCGKLKCCLNYELDQYLDAIKEFPPPSTKLFTHKGTAVHFKTDIFKRIMYFIYEEQMGGAPVALSIDALNEIMEMNKAGKKPDDLSGFIEREEVEEVDYLNAVGEDSLTRFDRTSKGGRKKKRKGRKPGGGPKNKGGQSAKGTKPNKGPKGKGPQNKGPKGKGPKGKPKGKGKGPKGGGKPKNKNNSGPKNDGKDKS
ncbi:PSP1 domain-containing protein [Halocola ammonii]